MYAMKCSKEFFGIFFFLYFCCYIFVACFIDIDYLLPQHNIPMNNRENYKQYNTINTSNLEIPKMTFYFMVYSLYFAPPPILFLFIMELQKIKKKIYKIY